GPVYTPDELGVEIDPDGEVITLAPVSTVAPALAPEPVPEAAPTVPPAEPSPSAATETAPATAPPAGTQPSPEPAVPATPATPPPGQKFTPSEVMVSLGIGETAQIFL